MQFGKALHQCLAEAEPSRRIPAGSIKSGQRFENTLLHVTWDAASRVFAADDDFGLFTYDPGFGATAACKSQNHAPPRSQIIQAVDRCPKGKE